jgi:predicted Zn-ribbon and HTH transcriptional regulator
MNPDSRKDKSKNNRTAKAIDAMPIAGIVVAALLVLPGLTIVGSYNSASAQQNTTGGGTQSEVMTHLEEVRKALQNNDNQGAMTHLDLAMNLGGTQSEVMTHLEEVRKALQNNDNQGAMTHLDLAMNLLRGGSTQDNTTSTPSSTNRYP